MAGDVGVSSLLEPSVGSVVVAVVAYGECCGVFSSEVGLVCCGTTYVACDEA